MDTALRTRADLLVDLADAINQLVDPTDHVEHVEVTVTETQESANGRRRKAKRTRRRRAHHVTLPSLLESLQAAMVPGASGEIGGPAGFESRPAAEVEPAAVLRNIRDDLTRWARKFGIRPPAPRYVTVGRQQLIISRNRMHVTQERREVLDMSSFRRTLRALVSADMSDDQLATLVGDAELWVRSARLACGYDAPPFTLNHPCPYCWSRHALVIAADLRSARCSRCGTAWSPDTIGLLADMLTANEERETMPTARCWMADCVRIGAHDEHADDRGHTWTREARCIGLDGLPVGQWSA